MDLNIYFYFHTFFFCKQLLDGQKFRGLVEKIKMVGTNTYMAAIGLQHQHETEHQLLMILKEIKQRNNEACQFNNKDEKYDNDFDVDQDLASGYELNDILSAYYVVYALDFVRDMRRVLHRQRSSIMPSLGNSYNSQSTQFTLRVG